jgi:hypothetical protein
MRRLRLRGAFELSDVEFIHLQHGLHGLWMFDEFVDARGRSAMRDRTRL